MGVVFSNGEDFVNVGMYSGSAPGIDHCVVKCIYMMITT